jgi:hypothetical protein
MARRNETPQEAPAVETPVETPVDITPVITARVTGAVDTPARLSRKVLTATIAPVELSIPVAGFAAPIRTVVYAVLQAPGMVPFRMRDGRQTPITLDDCDRNIDLPNAVSWPAGIDEAAKDAAVNALRAWEGLTTATESAHARLLRGIPEASVKAAKSAPRSF